MARDSAFQWAIYLSASVQQIGVERCAFQFSDRIAGGGDTGGRNPPTGVVVGVCGGLFSGAVMILDIEPCEISEIITAPTY